MKNNRILLLTIFILLLLLSGCGNAVADSGHFPAGGYALLEKADTGKTVFVKKKQPKKEVQEYVVAEIAESTLPPEIIPANFLEEAYEVDGFESYDEILSKLGDGNGYAYLKLEGSDEVLMAVAEKLYEIDGGFIVATGCSIYAKKDGKAECIGNVECNDDIYPVRVKDGLLYNAGEDQINSFFLTEDGYGLMTKDTITRIRNDDGGYDYKGILREDNTFGSKVQMLQGDAYEIFDKRFAEYLSAPILNFTVIGDVVIEYKTDESLAIEDEMAADGYYRDGEEESEEETESEETETENSEAESTENDASAGENTEGENAEGENADGESAERENAEGENSEDDRER